MATGDIVNISLATTSIRQILQSLITRGTSIGTVLGPLVGLLIWSLPVGLEPAAHKACAIVAFMVIYWITVPIEYGLTAFSGCFLFWATNATTFSVAFSGFTSSVPWFVLGALLIGQAATRTGLAKRLGYLIMQQVGSSYSRLLFGIILLSLLIQFLVPSPNAQIAILASVAIGFVSAPELEARRNVGKGLFLALTFASYFFSKMFLAGGPAILTRGIIEEQTGIQILWSHWALAFLPLTLLTVVACWLVIYWLYPPETSKLTESSQYIKDALHAMGPWRGDERKTMGWLVLAIALWSTDFLHHMHPALIGIGIALILTLPHVGVLDTAAVRSANFLLIIFLGGAISLGNVLVETQALARVTEGLIDWINPLLTTPFSSALTLYWGGFLYHIPIPNPNAMVGTALPILLDIAAVHQYNPIAVGLLWLFASLGTLFIYQASSFVLGYSYGYFGAIDLLKVGAILTVVEGIFIMVLVPVYWPLVGLPWTIAPAEQHVVPVQAQAVRDETADNHALEVGQTSQTTTSSAAMASPVADTRLRTQGLAGETTAWASIRNSTNPQDFAEFLAAFPETRFVFAAQKRLRQFPRHEQTATPLAPLMRSDATTVKIFPIILPILLTVLAGFGWVRIGRPFDTGVLTPLAADIGMPCLIFSTLATTSIPTDVFVKTALAAFMALAALATAGAIILSAARLRLQTYLPSITWGNAAFLGFPTALYAFGQVGLSHAIAFSAVSLVFNSIVSQAVAAGRANWQAILQAPLIYAIALGILVPMLHIELPSWVLKTISLIGGMTVPLMLMMLGVSLARLQVTTFRRALSISILRIGLGLGIGLAVATILDLQGVAKSVLVLQCAMPVAVYSYLLAQRWGNDPEEVAGLVVVSTWIAAFSMPLILKFMSL